MTEHITILYRKVKDQLWGEKASRQDKVERSETKTVDLVREAQHMDNYQACLWEGGYSLNQPYPYHKHLAKAKLEAHDHPLTPLWTNTLSLYKQTCCLHPPSSDVGQKNPQDVSLQKYNQGIFGLEGMHMDQSCQNSQEKVHHLRMDPIHIDPRIEPPVNQDSGCWSFHHSWNQMLTGNQLVHPSAAAFTKHKSTVRKQGLLQ